MHGTTSWLLLAILSPALACSSDDGSGSAMQAIVVPPGPTPAANPAGAPAGVVDPPATNDTGPMMGGAAGMSPGASDGAGATGTAGAAALDAPDAGVPIMEDAGAPAPDAGPDAGRFQPCPATEPCKILPLGDSITDGIGFSGGYRVELFRRARADGHDITFVGRSENGPGTVDGELFPRNHEGHSGWTIGQIDGIVPDPALAPTPHIVLLHLGTNDMYRTPAGAPERLGELIDQVVDELPDALLVVSTIIPFPGAAGAVDDFNDAIPAVVEVRAAAGKHVILVDQFTGFPTSELGDGVHPNQAGYERMAGVWYTAIVDVLP